MSDAALPAPAPPARTTRPVRLPNRIGAVVLGAALVLGLAGDALLRAADWGLNLALWLTALAVLATLFARRSDSSARARLALGALVFAAAVAWRVARTLQARGRVALSGPLR